MPAALGVLLLPMVVPEPSLVTLDAFDGIGIIGCGPGFVKMVVVHAGVPLFVRIWGMPIVRSVELLRIGRMDQIDLLRHG